MTVEGVGHEGLVQPRIDVDVCAGRVRVGLRERLCGERRAMHGEIVSLQGSQEVLQGVLLHQIDQYLRRAVRLGQDRNVVGVAFQAVEQFALQLEG